MTTLPLTPEGAARRDGKFLYAGEVRIAVQVVGGLSNNCWLLVDPDTLDSALIDAPAEPERILRMAEGTRLRQVFITHRHPDHWGALQEVARMTGARVGIHPAEAGALPVTPDFFLNHADILQVGKVPIQVLWTPGHTPGSCCLVTGRHLFSGDTLFEGGPGHTDSPEAFREEMASITRHLLPLRPETAVYSGHGPQTTIGAAGDEYAVFIKRPHPTDLCGDIVWKET